MKTPESMIEYLTLTYAQKMELVALPSTMLTPLLADADIFEGRAYELRDVAQWLDLNGQNELGRQVRNLAAKVYEIAIEKRKANDQSQLRTK